MTVKELYDSINGNYQNAKNLMMTDNFIIKMLTKFLNNEYYSKMVEGYNNKDYKAVFEASHGLKGLAGNLALSLLSEKASYICEATRNLGADEHPNLDKELAELSQMYQDITKKISDFVA